MIPKIGKIIKLSIKKQNMTQDQFAKKLHVSPQALSNYINNKRTPHLECFFQLMDLLDLEEYFMYPHLSDKKYINKYISNTIKTLSFDQLQLLYLILKAISNKE